MRACLNVTKKKIKFLIATLFLISTFSNITYSMEKKENINYIETNKSQISDMDTEKENFIQIYRNIKEDEDLKRKTINKETDTEKKFYFRTDIEKTFEQLTNNYIKNNLSEKLQNYEEIKEKFLTAVKNLITDKLNICFYKDIILDIESKFDEYKTINKFVYPLKNVIFQEIDKILDILKSNDDKDCDNCKTPEDFKSISTLEDVIEKTDYYFLEYLLNNIFKTDYYFQLTKYYDKENSAIKAILKDQEDCIKEHEGPIKTFSKNLELEKLTPEEKEKCCEELRREIKVLLNDLEATKIYKMSKLIEFFKEEYGIKLIENIVKFLQKNYKKYNLSRYMKHKKFHSEKFTEEFKKDLKEIKLIKDSEEITVIDYIFKIIDRKLNFIESELERIIQNVIYSETKDEKNDIIKIKEIPIEYIRRILEFFLLQNQNEFLKETNEIMKGKLDGALNEVFKSNE